MSLRELVEHSGDQLTAADRRLVDALLVHPRETAFLSANEIAQRAQVDPATAVRFARKLGFEGYPALRAKLQMDLFGISEAAERMRQRIRRLGRGSVLSTFVEGEISHLARLPEQIADADLLAAARALRGARQIFLFAVGHAGALAHLLESRLGRTGRRMRMLKHVPRDMSAQLLQADRGDAFILFALNAVHPLVPRVIEHARGTGAGSVLISDIMGIKTQPCADVALVASRGSEGEPRSLTVPMAICNALVLQLSRLDRKKTIGNLKRLDRIREKLESTP